MPLHRAVAGFGAGIGASWPGIDARHRFRGEPGPQGEMGPMKQVLKEIPTCTRAVRDNNSIYITRICKNLQEFAIVTRIYERE